MKRNRFLFVFLITVLLSACPPPEGSETGNVTFFNGSSYTVTVHLNDFHGPVLIESLGTGQSREVNVRTSDNYGSGSVFSIEYSYNVVDGTDLASGEVWARGIDPNIQITVVVEENQSYTIQIPQPTELEFPMAFIKIFNGSNMEIKLCILDTEYNQTGNGNIPVPPGEIGVYEIHSTAAGLTYRDYSIRANFNSVDVPEFTAKNSYVYNFTYDGSSVRLRSEQKIIF
jgi:hypothetical protein